MPERPARRQSFPDASPKGVSVKPLAQAPATPKGALTALPAPKAEPGPKAPGKPASGTQRANLTVRLSPEERTKLQVMADRLGYTLANTVRWLIRKEP